MSLGIFSFDLTALIYGLSNFLEAPSSPVNQEAILDQVEVVLQDSAAAVDSKIDDILIAAALNSTITSVINAAETVKKENPPTISPSPPVPVPKPGLDEETRREIERLIKLLQTSVTHNYRSSDIIDEAVSLHRVANFPRRAPERENSERKNESIEQERKREAQKLELLRAELKKARLKNNTGV